MSQSQRVTGSSSMSYPSPIEGMECSTSSATWTLGFRLVHENRVYAGIANGNVWFSPQENARSLCRQFHLPGGLAKTVGFRLAFDREGQ